MQLKFLSVLCLALCAHVSAVRELSGSSSKSLLQERRGSARAKASTSGGSVVVEAKVFSTTKARSSFVTAIAEAITKVESDDGDAIALAEAAASSYAVAIAEAYAEASVTIVSTSNNTRACGHASANASSSASASAEALVNVLAEASNRIAFFDASGAIEAIQNVTVSAFASAKASACANGVGRAEATASQLSQAIGVAFAEVSALALAVVTPGADAAEILVKASSDNVVVTTVDGRTAGQVVGDAQANADVTGVASGERR